MTLSPYESTLSHIKETAALGQVAGLLSWDQETMMPKRGVAMRAEQMAAMESVLHARKSDPQLGEWLAAIDEDSLDPVAQVNVARTRRAFDRANRVPAHLSAELARTTALAHGLWATARAADDFASFAPTLEKIVELKREEAACLTDEGDELYDALLDDFESGMKLADLAGMLERLRPGLADLRARIAESGKEIPPLSGTFDRDGQMIIARAIADAFHYDWAAGRLDFSIHPFSSEIGREDVRITTRISETDPFNCLYSTAHELGHALYEQGTPAAHAFEPAGASVSMGVHESQSRLWENQIGRSRAFCRWLFPRMKEQFGDFGVADVAALYEVVNRVETGFIRTEADEVHYNLHILLRFDLERALIKDELQVRDLEGAWNERFERDFGRKVEKASDGVLQDVHWAAGLFGYFPTYSLGNIFAGELDAALCEAVPNVDDLAENGDLRPILDWLRTNIHEKGSLLAPLDLIEDVVGHKPTEKPLLDYLNRKFGGIYGV